MAEEKVTLEFLGRSVERLLKLLGARVDLADDKRPNEPLP